MGVMAAILLASGTQAVTVVNKTTGQTLFFDDFEGASGVSHTDFPDASGDYDPSQASVGTWTPVSESLREGIQVTDYQGGENSPAATPQGTNYLRVVRNNNSASATATLSALQSVSGNLIHVEAMIWIPRDVTATTFQLIIRGSNDEMRANLYTVKISGSGDSSAVYAYDATLPTPKAVDSTFDWLANTWQKWEVDYAVGGETFDLSIDGVKKTFPRSGPAGDVKAVEFKGGAPGEQVRFYVDSTGYNGTQQKTFTLFRDSFENCTNGAVPSTIMPDIGTYQNVYGGTKVCSDNLSGTGGPPAAYSGSNYVELSRLTGSISLGCAFAGGAVNPNVQELHTRFRLWWGGAGYPGHGLRTSMGTWDSTNCLTYNMIWSDASYREYDGPTESYVSITPANSFPKNMWVPVELVWYPKRLESKVSINGGLLLPNRLWGSVPSELYQMFFSSGSSNTVYWIDDVESYLLYTPPPPQGTIIKLK